MTGSDLPDIGVEEEFLLVDAATGRPAPLIDKVIADARAEAGDSAQSELHSTQIETATDVCSTLDDLRLQVSELRAAMARAAARHGARVAAAATYPGPMGPEGRLITDRDRYEDLAAQNGLIADEQLICGCHIHVSVGGPDAAVAVCNRIRRWLPVILALSGNSPYWEGRDSGYSSFRTEVWSRWPSAGPPGEFADVADYWRTVDALVEAGVILDRAMAYWDVRPSAKYPTVEIRVADVALTVDDVVTLAGLARALVLHCTTTPGPAPHLRPEFLRAAQWKAARTGLEGTLMDPLDGSTRPAADAVHSLASMLTEPLDRLGDRDQVEEGLRRILSDGNGAQRQRRAFEQNGSVRDVIDLASI